MRFTKTGKGTAAKIQRELDALGEKDITAIKLRGPDAQGPEYALFWMTSEDSASEEVEVTNSIEIVLPFPETVEQANEASRWLTSVAAKFPLDTGYAAPAVVATSEEAFGEVAEAIGALAQRFIGLDLAQNEWTAGSLGRLSRGARWITFLSRSHSGQLNEIELPTPPHQLSISDFSGIRKLQTSEMPEVCDSNRQQDCQGLEWVAGYLEPITFFGDANLLEYFEDDEDALERWETRFLGGRDK
ncbi:DUF3396 domain-containing protein [Ruegeria sp. XHP0148]|uniref:DUF3396 domain-containing protein n=2 Tax=Ruegeria aquimaris TaxID=2984333 RepID=A0ABT3ANQ0_9RHOB|nr:DUF3396 domain-containing protein [Ruegeria sp. XHP0148]MCV2890307.1 DUF3396 domain-containing protein [Ruegeria sp. XHP0148]